MEDVPSVDTNSIPAGKLEKRAGRWRRAREVLDRSLVTFFEEDSLTVSASIAYFGLLSIFPMMLLLVSLSGIYIRHFELSGDLTVVLQGFLPMKPDFIMRELVKISEGFGRVTVISFAILLWSASGIFRPLEKALNRAWGVEETRPWWRSYLLALEMALLFALFVSVYTGLVGWNFYIQGKFYRWAELHPAPALTEFTYQILFAATTFAMTLSIFTLLFRRLPNRQLKTRHVLPSAFLTAIFWEGARTMFTLLLPRFNYSHVYGSIGAVVALMTWLYISSAVTLFGAHVSGNLYTTLRRPAPDPGAATQSSGAAPYV
ncbi:MAG: YihY/virulence factor BrkB family protein [Terriglobia bacterium]|jgi:YihY family inner membrane protein